ncbi:P-loop containing nucleoside triphosphate hydrolase protein, partial [Nadsonia fulvescens var. elongata DSM 6958]
ESKFLKSYLLAAETGSGKTLAYLIPLMSKLKDLETTEEWKHIQNHPVIRSVVLVPTMELVEQVTKTVKNMSHQVKLRAFGYGVNPQLTPAKLTSQRVDVLITTPTKFINLYAKHANLVKYCSFMVADEADSLLDESFGPEITKAVAMCPNLTELVFTSATIPRSFDKLITKQYPDLNRLVTPGIHRVSRRIEFTTVNVWEPPFLDNKELALNQALYSTHTDNKEDGLIKRVIVFRNNRKDVKSTVDFINKVGYDAFGVDGSVPYETRDELIKDFITPPKRIDDSYEKKPHIKVMVTTDLLARGIDMSAVRNVVLYDIPNTSIDLIHRIGRTGRMGKRGRVYLFVNKSENKPWIQGLKSYIRKGMSL